MKRAKKLSLRSTSLSVKIAAIKAREIKAEIQKPKRVKIRIPRWVLDESDFWDDPLDRPGKNW